MRRSSTALGNNHQNLRELATRTGGALIDPADHRAIAFHWPRETVDLSAWFSAAGVVLLLIALVRFAPCVVARSRSRANQASPDAG